MISDSVTVSSLPFSVYIDEFTDGISICSLSEHAQRSLTVANAGGSSEVSEAFSIHYFQNFANINRYIRGFIFEMEARYDFYNSSICDFLINFGTHRIGVSVTRAYATHADIRNATRLLRKKLFGLIVARSGINTNDDFDKCILHIWCINSTVADTLVNAYNEIIADVAPDDGIRDVVIMITISDNPLIYQ